MHIKFLNHGKGSAAHASAYVLDKLDHLGNVRAGVEVLKGIQTELEQVFPALPKISRQSPERLKKQLSSVQLAEEDESAY